MTTVTTVSATSAWSDRNFRAVWRASTLSAVGAEVGELALPVLALVTLEATARQLSWVRVALFLPALLFTLVLGVVVERRRSRGLMILADLGRGGILIGVSVAAVVGVLSVPALVAAAAMLGTLTVLYGLADFAFLPKVVAREQLADANARITATHSAVAVAGSGAGGVLVQVLTAPLAVAANGLAYLLSALCVQRVTVVEEVAPRRGDRGVVAEAFEGVAALARHRVVRPLAAEATLWNLGNEALMLGITVLLISTYGSGPLVLGIVVMMGGLGAFAGSSLSARVTRRWGYGRGLTVSLLVGNTAPLLVILVRDGSVASLVVLGVMFGLSGLGVGMANSQAITVRQLAVPEHLRARVNAAYRLVSWGALSIGALAAGVLVELTSPHTAAIAGAAVMALATAPVVLSPVRAMRTLEQPEQPEQPSSTEP